MHPQFFVALEDEIDDVVVADGPSGRFEVVLAKVDYVSIAKLGNIVGAGTYDAILDRIFDSHRGSHGYAGLYLVPDEVRDSLASAADPDAVAAQWRATDEMREWEPSEVGNVVRDLAALAQGARQTGRHVWCWWSV